LSKNKKTVDEGVVRPQSKKMASQVALRWTFSQKRAEIHPWRSLDGTRSRLLQEAQYIIIIYPGVIKSTAS
jgi:hypothetical protein